MLLAIDAGNTNVVFAVFEGADCRQSWRCKTDSSRTADEYAAWLFQMLSMQGLKFADIDAAIIGSVVPDASFNLKNLCQKYIGCAPVMIKSDLEGLGLTLKVNKPEEVGADRLVNAFAIKAYYRYPAIVVDFGTATTFDVVDADGAYCGGAIAPGVHLSMAALHQAAAKLPRIEVRKPITVIGRDTIGAMQSGVYWGYVSMVEGMIAKISAELGQKPFVLATGGLAGLLEQGAKGIDQIDEDLTLKGLVGIYNKHKTLKAAL